MTSLPIIVGFGGISPAGRSSGLNGYRRLVFESLDLPKRISTLQSLGSLTGRLKKDSDGTWLWDKNRVLDIEKCLTENSLELLDGTLVRKLETNLFDPQRIIQNKNFNFIANNEQGLQFSILNRHLPRALPQDWQMVNDNGETTSFNVSHALQVNLSQFSTSLVNTAGQLPTGFDPASLYASRNHPRGLQLTVFGASDALDSMGIEWEEVRKKVAPDRISVYAGSCLSQLDGNGNGGLLQARLRGKRVSSKQLPLGLAEMPADFINAYLLGSMGTTGASQGACATFLYNLRNAVEDIRRGTHRVAIVGTSEAPLTPEVLEGFCAMGALADDAGLRTLDSLSNNQQIDHRKACRPFGNNCGFTLSESAQFVVLFDDELALELGANVQGAVNDVFISADGYKKSISGPGAGNTICMAKAMSATRHVLGEANFKNRCFMQAHGTGTPQNRTTESAMFSRLAKEFGIKNLPVLAIKSYLGHSVASSAGDQLMATLGVWQDGILPAIQNVDTLAQDVSSQNLDFVLEHRNSGTTAFDAAFLNSKGFGGNNASASVLSPTITKAMLKRRHGKKAMKTHEEKHTKVRELYEGNEIKASAGSATPLYRFNYNVLNDQSLNFEGDAIKIKGTVPPIKLTPSSAYDDMIE
jgi:acetoacetyl-[acyl-carrier protein] synthase